MRMWIMDDVLPIIRTVFISECDESNAFIGLGRTCQDPGDLREDHYRNATVQPQLGDSHKGKLGSTRPGFSHGTYCTSKNPKGH